MERDDLSQDLAKQLSRLNCPFDVQIAEQCTSTKIAGTACFEETVTSFADHNVISGTVVEISIDDNWMLPCIITWIDWNQFNFEEI